MQKEINDIIEILPSEEYNKILSELKTPIKYESIPQKLAYKYNSIKKINHLLLLSNIDCEELYDKDIQFKGLLSMFITSMMILKRKRGKILTAHYLGANVILHQIAINQIGFERGLYKEALYGTTQISQEIRLLLNFYFPKHHYAELFKELIDNHNYCDKKFN